MSLDKSVRETPVSDKLLCALNVQVVNMSDNINRLEQALNRLMGNLPETSGQSKAENPTPPSLSFINQLDRSVGDMERLRDRLVGAVIRMETFV